MNYPTVKIDDIKESVAIGPFGSRMKAELYVQAGVPVIRGNNLTRTKWLTGDFVYVSPETAAQLASCSVRPGDLVFPHRGAIGEVGLIPESMSEGMLSTSLMRLRVNREATDPLYVFYFFVSDMGRQALLENSSQVGTPGISTPLRSLRSIRIPLPPEREQRRIAALLGALDDKIELNRRMNETLEEMARSLFRSWFVDFDPVRIKARGGDPEASLGIARQVSALFPGTWAESPLGEIPTGWKTGTVADLCKRTVNGGTPSRSISEFWNGGSIRWFTTGELTDDWLTDSKQHITPKGLEGSNARVLPSGSVLMAIYAAPTVGRLGIISEEAAFNQACTGMIPRDGVGTSFLYESLHNLRGWFNLAANGAAQQNISKGIVESAPIILPDTSILHEFEKGVGPLLELRLSSNRETSDLANLRNYLLPRLLSGQVTVGEAEKALA